MRYKSDEDLLKELKIVITNEKISISPSLKLKILGLLSLNKTVNQEEVNLETLEEIYTYLQAQRSILMETPRENREILVILTPLIHRIASLIGK